MRNYYLNLLLAAFFACLFSTTTVNAQDWEFLEKQADPESVNLNKFKNVERLSYYADTLPSWFFSVPQEADGFYAIGISDPDMEPQKAKTLALHRAKTMAVLLSNCKVQYIRDIYSAVNDYEKYTEVRERFDTYFKISGANQVYDNMFSVVDTHFTKYNEYMVLIKYLPQVDLDFEGEGDDDEVTPTSCINVAGTSFIVEASVSGAFETQAEYEVVSYNKGEEQEKGNFAYREKEKRFLSKSYFNEEEIDFPLYSYTYASPLWTQPRSAYSSYSGLWSVYMRQFFNYLSISCENNCVKMKNTDQSYGEEMVYLSREIASFLAELKINGINFDSDTLKFDLNIVETKRLVK